MTEIEPFSQYVCEHIRQLRKRHNLTLQQLASSSGVSRSMLSQVERGSANPTLSVAFRIAQAFGISLADLVEGATSEQRVEVIRKTDEQSVFRDDENCRIRTLSPLNLEKDVEFYEVTLPPQGRLDSAAHFQGTREFLTVQTGLIEIQSGDIRVELGKGDSVQYPADVDHSIKNIGKRDAILFLVDIYSSNH
ncbi:MAG: XRE family transcriptional regulator [Mariniblastus sp.]|nr:XRE family transcriptional regulator [Mariniblastus sp.]